MPTERLALLPFHTISEGEDSMVRAVTEKIREYIVENFLYTRPEFVLGDDDALLAGGIIDSMGVMEVIMFVEQEFGVTVRDEDITEDNLGSVRAIASYVMTHGSESRLRHTA